MVYWRIGHTTATKQLLRYYKKNLHVVFPLLLCQLQTFKSSPSVDNKHFTTLCLLAKRACMESTMKCNVEHAQCHIQQYGQQFD